jgi:choline-glycine betaine transporter
VLVKKVWAVVLGAALTVLMAVPAFAQTPTAETVKDDVIAEATPYFTILIAVVIGLFGLALLVALARKAAGMAKGAVKKG